MQPAQVFISYRRDDAAGYARAIGDELARQFGAERVFIDVDDIHAGQPFSEVIERQIGASQVLLVLIGRRWLGEQAGGSPRIGEAGDFVRREVAAGLAQGARVIPVLLDGAPMPSESQLPAELRALAGRNALEIDNSRYPADMSRLVSALRDALEGSGPTALPLTKRTGRAPGLAVALVGAVFVVGVIAALWPRHQALNPFVDERPLRPESGVSDRTASRPDVNGLWQAEVTYDWPNARYAERFDLRGDATELHGTASFLGVPRGLLEGRIESGQLSFVTRTAEVGVGGSHDIEHRYRARLIDGELRIVMQTEGGNTPHAPIEFVARRSAAAASTAGR